MDFDRPTLVKRKKVERKDFYHPEKTKKPDPKQTRISFSEERMKEFWRELGLKETKEGSAGFRADLQNLRKLKNGTLFNSYPEYSKYHGYGFDDNEIKAVMEQFAVSCFDASFKPEKKEFIQKMTMGNFFLNAFSPIKSTFLFMHEKGLEPINSDLPSANPKVVQLLMHKFSTEITGGVSTEFNASRGKFVLASSRLEEFFRKNASKIRSGIIVNDIKKATWLFEAVRSDMRENATRMTPGYLCSDETFERRLPAYLYSQAIIGVKEFGRK